MRYKLDLNRNSIYIKETELHFKHRKLIRELGAGANGVVIECLDDFLEAKLAIKVWFPRSGDSFLEQNRFVSEVKKLKQVSEHQYIATLYHVNYGNGFYYAEIELIEGIVLAKWLEHKKTQRDRFRIAKQIIEAMDYAHSLNVYHGDLHKKNIMISNNFQVKILDFGTSLFSPKTSALRSSYLLARTLGVLILQGKESYTRLLDEQIIEFLMTPNFQIIKKKYKNKDYLKPEIVLASFEILMELIVAIEDHITTVEEPFTILGDLAQLLAKSPFLRMKNLLSLFQELIKNNYISFFLERLFDATQFHEYDPIELLDEDLEKYITSFELTGNTFVMYLGLQDFRKNIKQYRSWRKFYAEVLEKREIFSLVNSK
ncbi:protein kinase domain-containing protein [Paenibacillus sp. 1-18]|uniref:protein kinase domain-containing protein n=1 Tax=Paenibacillus sp. 1-18 TaxID=1333846 RepID=UPI0004728EAF|nr:protein kinase [Paenibacillus sp. 1-18]